MYFICLIMIITTRRLVSISTVLPASKHTAGLPSLVIISVGSIKPLAGVEPTYHGICNILSQCGLSYIYTVSTRVCPRVFAVAAMYLSRLIKEAIGGEGVEPSVVAV